MVSLSALWLPILLSAVLVFVWSSISHMVLKLHSRDYDAMPGEANIMAAMRKENVGPGNYMMPHCATQSEMNTPEMKKKWEQGPVGLFNVLPSGQPAMGKNLVQWFIYTLIVALFVAYLTTRTVAADADYLQVFRVAGTAAFLAYAMGHPMDSIWKGQRWGTTARHAVDGVVYSLLTAGTFGWLWP